MVTTLSSSPCPSPWPQHGAAHGCQGHCQNPALCPALSPWGTPQNSHPGTKPLASPSHHHPPGWLLKPPDSRGVQHPQPRGPPRVSELCPCRGSAALPGVSHSRSAGAIPNLLYTERGQPGPTGEREGAARGSPGRCPARGQVCSGCSCWLRALGRLPAAMATVTARPPPPRTSRETSPPVGGQQR